MSISRTFPSDLVLHEQAVRIPPDATSNEQLWVPGVTEQNGKFQRYIRYLLVSGNAGEVQRIEELAALPVQLQQCIIDIRTGFLRWGGHGHQVAFSVPAPLGAHGKEIPADVLSRKPDQAVAVWAPGQPQPDQVRVASFLPGGTRLEPLQNGWLAHGAHDALLARWKIQAAPPPVIRQSGIASPVITANMSLEAGLQVMGQNLHLLNTHPQPGLEQQFEARISAAESAFLEFGQHLGRKIDAMPQDTYPRQALRRSLHLPFQIVANNRANPLRNGEVAARLASQHGVPPEIFLLAQQQPHHYAYENLPIQFVAAFAPTRRSMILPPDLNPQNPMFKWAKLHETYHIYQFAEHRRRMGLDGFLRFMNGSNPVFLVDEVQAYGYELEAMNLELDGELRKIAQAGGVLDGDRMRQQLGGIDDRYRTPMQFLAYIGTQYFRDGKEDGVYPQAYVQSVLQCLIHDGQTPYQLDTNGQPQKI